ncbi:hypothetical protein JIQ42_08161 [Leishmania sp. Namibia]|uniref:hypothetical protein n=1 Tax=Leishmania sp. Namibia TaxID=2802991 RepID=UPI001B62FC75|nr:hypothetical protein JIQ42_08161 [Leishmania sp. Namibia]
MGCWHCRSLSAKSASHEVMPAQLPGRLQPSSSSCLSPPPPSQPTTRRLCALAAGVLIFHLLASALQETIFHLPGFSNVLLLSCGETLCTTVLVGLLLVWGWCHQLPGRAASEHHGLRDRSTATAAGKETVEATLHETLAKPAHRLDGTSNEPGCNSGSATPCSQEVFCEAEHRPPGHHRSLARGDHGSVFTRAVDALPVAVTARTGTADGAEPSTPTPSAVHDAPPAGSASWRSTIRDVFHPSTVSLYWYVRIAVLLSCSLYLTNRTSFFLSYALQVIFKSSKLLCMIVVHRWWVHDSHEEAAPDSGHELDSGDGAPNGDGSSEPRAAAAVAGITERHPSDEAQRRGGRCSLLPSTPPPDAVVVDVSPPAGQALAPSHPLEEDQTRSWWGAPRYSSGSRRRSCWWWSRCWHQQRVDDVSRWGARRGWSCASYLAQCCALRSAKSIGDERAQNPASTGLRRLIYHNSGSDGAPSAFEMLRVAGAWLARQLRRRWQDTELMACIIIVVGLISFTYASQLDVRVATGPSDAKKGPAAFSKAVIERYIFLRRLRGHSAAPFTGEHSVSAGVADSLNIDTGLAEGRASLPLQASSLSASPSLLQSITAVVSCLSAPWLVTLIGVAGVLTSNTLDCIIYVLEEVYCFHATAQSSSRGRVRAHKHERAVQGRAHPESGAPHGAVPLQHRAFHPPHSLLPCRVPSSSRMRASVTAPSKRHVVSAPSATERPASAPVPASSEELLFMVNGIATLLYAGGLSASWLCDRFSLSLQSITSANMVPTVLEAEGGVVGALTAAEAQQLVACEHLVVLSGSAGSASIPIECAALMARQRQLQRLSFMSAWPSSAALSAPQLPSTEGFPLYFFWALIALASVTSLMGTLCLLRIVAEFTGVMAIIVTSVRKALTVLLSFVLYRRRFTLLHSVGLAGVMGGAVWYELQRRRRRGV